MVAELSKHQIKAVALTGSQAGIVTDGVYGDAEVEIYSEPDTDCEQVKNLLAELDCQASVIPGFAKVTVVGRGMRGIPGVMARIVKALNKAETEIFQTADSHLNISCLILAENLTAAVKALHLEFNLSDSNRLECYTEC